MGPEEPAAVGRDTEIAREALRIIDAAAAARVPVRLLGGLAISLHSSDSLPTALTRDYADIDLFAPSRTASAAGALISSLGYEDDRVFNRTNAGRRGNYFGDAGRLKIDLFIGNFEMCHVIPLEERIDVESVTIPLAELLVTKLQIFHLNEKDQRDALALILEHDVGELDHETINADRIAKLCAADWGLWRTVQLNLERIRPALTDYDVTEAQQQVITSRLDAIWERIEHEPKPRSWKLRNRVGDRLRWYEEPEE